MAGEMEVREMLDERTPYTHAAMQELALAMAGAANNTGKKTFFGGDKGRASYNKFLGLLSPLVVAMWKDNLITAKASETLILKMIQDVLVVFKVAYPNWQDAYKFADFFFIENEAHAIAVLSILEIHQRPK